MKMPALLLLLAVSHAPPENLRAEAETAYQAGLQHLGDAERARPYFARAAQAYDAMRQAGAVSPDLFLNQGNACYLADDLPGAILAYRRGLRLAPADAQLRANLAFARQQVIYPQAGRFARPAIEHRPPWLPRWPGRLFTLALGLYLAGCLALARWWMVRDGFCLRFALWSLAIAFLPLAGSVWEEWQIRHEEQQPLVVIQRDDVRLRKGNGTSYPTVIDVPLNRGVEAKQLFQRGDWLQVELGSGEIGWLRQYDCLLDAD